MESLKFINIKVVKIEIIIIIELLNVANPINAPMVSTMYLVSTAVASLLFLFENEIYG